MILTCHVTQRHIDAGEPKNCRSCPVALCLQEMFYPGVDIAVGASKVDFIKLDGTWSTGWKETSGTLSRDMYRFICLFDTTVSARPTKFDIQVTDELKPFLAPNVTYQEDKIEIE
jgi:hypothetical protein